MCNFSIHNIVFIKQSCKKEIDDVRLDQCTRYNKRGRTYMPFEPEDGMYYTIYINIQYDALHNHFVSVCMHAAWQVNTCMHI